jgi:ubiquinone biosynthesis protein UbiJ
VASVVRTVGEHVQRTGRNLLDTAAEYLLDENPQLVRRATLADFNVELAHARDALARVEKRIERLEQKVEARGVNAPGGAATSRGTR